MYLYITSPHRMTRRMETKRTRRRKEKKARQEGLIVVKRQK